VGGGSTSAIVTSLNNGTRYYFTVRAFSPAAAGPQSNEASAVPN